MELHIDRVIDILKENKEKGNTFVRLFLCNDGDIILQAYNPDSDAGSCVLVQ